MGVVDGKKGARAVFINPDAGSLQGQKMISFHFMHRQRAINKIQNVIETMSSNLKPLRIQSISDLTWLIDVFYVYFLQPSICKYEANT